MADHRWINDIAGHLTVTGIAQCLLLLSTVAGIFRDVSQPDVFSWPWETGGTYTARSTYMALSQGSTVMAGAKCIWGSWAPLKCKIFAWLALQHRLWTADRRTRHGLQTETSPCFLCLQEEDTAEHILIQCVYAREAWLGVLQRLGSAVRPPEAGDHLGAWWLGVRRALGKHGKREFDTLVILLAWHLWKQRNARAFNNPSRQREVQDMVRLVLEDWQLWSSARQGGSGSRTLVRD